MAACPSGHIHNTRQLNKRRRIKHSPSRVSATFYI
jgi:hypothetical protein